MSINSINFNSAYGTCPITAPDSQGAASVYVDKKVDKDFAKNTIEQYEYLCAHSKNPCAKNLIILSNPNDINQIDAFGDDIKQYFAGDGEIAYGLYSKKYDTIFITESNHERKVEALEGKKETQGADTLTHEYGHLLDKGASQSASFREAYLKDLKNLEKMLNENPNQTIGNSTMTANEALEYFKHYLEGTDFADGIDENDLTKRGLREGFAEAFSSVFDSKRSEVNAIYEELFKNSCETVREIFVA